MYFVYLLKSDKDRKVYVGWTTDLKERLRKHNLGLVDSTKTRRPLKLIFYECFLDKKDALSREKFFKTGWGRRHLKLALSNTLVGRDF